MEFHDELGTSGTASLKSGYQLREGKASTCGLHEHGSEDRAGLDWRCALLERKVMTALAACAGLVLQARVSKGKIEAIERVSMPPIEQCGGVERRVDDDQLTKKTLRLATRWPRKLLKQRDQRIDGERNLVGSRC